MSGLTDLLHVTTGIANDADIPTDHDGAHDLIDAVDDTTEALDGLRDRLVRVCIDDPNRWGICPTCGLSLQRPSQIAGPHNPGEPLCFKPVVPALWAYRQYWRCRRLTSRVFHRARYKAGLVASDDAALLRRKGA
ncbi:MAG TPA: hypothetical protein VK611_25005 [Acidimicrobiales bacterium]|nr:hypothetical protein [Acidimicrobiales bacterium]